MSGTWPSTPGFRTTTLRSQTGILFSRANSGKVQVRDTGRHLWSFSAVYPRLTREAFAPVWAFVRAQRGPFGSFQIIPPDLATPRGALGGTPVVNGAGQSGTSLSLTGCTANVTNWLRAGDVVKLVGHSKVYQLTADANTNGSGNVTLAIEPALIATPANAEALTIINVPFTMMLTGNVQEYSVESPLFYRYEVDLEERL